MLRSAFIVWNEREVLTWRYARPRRWEPRCRRNAGQALMDIERRYRRGVFKDITWWARSVDAERVEDLYSIGPVHVLAYAPVLHVERMRGDADRALRPDAIHGLQHVQPAADVLGKAEAEHVA